MSEINNQNTKQSEIVKKDSLGNELIEEINDTSSENIKKENISSNGENFENETLEKVKLEDEEIDIDEDDLDNDEDDDFEPIDVSNLKPDFYTKALDFISKKKEYFITFGILSAFYLFFLFINSVFSGEKTVLISDSYAQVGVFFSHFFKFLRGEASLMYSNYFGKGIEIFSTLQYMHFNPFYLIVLLGGEGLIYEMFTVAIYLMLLFTAFVFIWFTNKYFKNIDLKLKILLALMYVISPYINYNYGFISWFIYPALTLILVDRFLNFVKTKKIASFIVTFVWYIVSCFSVGISTAIVLFVVFTAYLFVVVNKDERKACTKGLFVVFAATALISITLLFPSIIGVLESKRTGNFFDNLMTKGSYDSSKLTLIIADYCVLFIAIYYFIFCDKKDKINRFLIVAFAIVYMPMILDAIMKILCFSQYNSFYGRFYFLNEVAIFVPTLFAFDKKMLKTNDCKSDRFLQMIIEVFMFGIVLGLLVIGVANFKNMGLVIKNPKYVDSVAMKLYLCFAAVSVILFLTSYIFNVRKSISGKMVNISLIFIMICSLGFNCLTFTSSASADINYKNKITAFLEDKNLDGNAKVTGFAIKSEILDGLSSIRQTSVFSSLVSAKTLESFWSLGYTTSSVSYIDSSGSLLSDALNGIKYYLSADKLERPYLKEIDYSKDAGYYLYESSLALDGVFLLDSDFEFDKSSSIDNFNKLKDYYNISGDFFENVDVQIEWYDENEELVELEEGETVERGLYKKQKITYKATKPGILYANSYLIQEQDEDGLDNFFLYRTDSSIYQDMAYLEAGDEISFIIRNYYNDTALENIGYRFLDYSVAKEFCEKVIDVNASYDYTKNGYEVTVNSDKACNMYVMTPNILGMNYTLNGEKVEIQEVLGSMVCVSINAGESTLVAKYSYPHAILWILVAAVSIIIVGILIALYHYKKLDFAENIIYYAMMVICALIIAVVYVAGSGISVLMLFK